MLISFTFTYPLNEVVVGTPQMTSQPVSSISLCSPLPSGTWQTPGLSIPWCCLPTFFPVYLVFFPLSLCLARCFWQDLVMVMLVTVIINTLLYACTSLEKGGGQTRQGRWNTRACRHCERLSTMRWRRERQHVLCKRNSKETHQLRWNLHRTKTIITAHERLSWDRELYRSGHDYICLLTQNFIFWKFKSFSLLLLILL